VSAPSCCESYTLSLHDALPIYGCQMLSTLAEIVPGSEQWPRFVKNRSERFEARVAMVEIGDSRSAFLQGMAGSRMPIAIAHGERSEEHTSELQSRENLVCRLLL